MSEYHTSRRSMLRLGGAALAAGLTSSTAGCLGTLGLGGSSPDVYRSWLLEPRLFDRDHYSVFFLRPMEMDENRQEIDREFYDNFAEGVEQQFPFLPLRFYDIEWIVLANDVQVIRGEYEVETVVSELRRNDFAYREDYEGYEIHERGEQQAVAVGDETIVVGRGRSQSALRSVRAAIDADQGSSERRYHEANSDFEDATDVIGAPTFATAYTHEPHDETDVEQGRFRNQVATGVGVGIDGETTQITASLVFLADRDVYVPRIESWTRQADSFRRVYDIEVEQNDHVAIVDGTIDSRDLGTFEL